MIPPEMFRKLLFKSIVICGPSGVGKGTLIAKLLDDYCDCLELSVSYTSRSPRSGEIDGVHYHFVSKEFLENDIKSGPIPYIEHALVHSNLYGTREDDVNKIHEKNKICLLDVDVNGVKQLKIIPFNAKYIFIAPPSVETLVNRLRKRGTEKLEAIELRTKNAKAEIEYGLKPENFDKVIVNDKLDDAFDQLEQYCQECFPNVFK